MNLSRFISNVRSKYQRTASRLNPRTINVAPEKPLVSFTFDDFPISALTVAGRLLEERSAAGTYYVSLGLLGQSSPVGEICRSEDLQSFRNTAHELACHTFDHCHSWNTPARDYEASILRNQARIRDLLPEYRFNSFSYPISWPSPGVKRAVARHFAYARGGDQRFNVGRTDASQLYSFFLERARGNFESVRNIVDRAVAAKGWLIFSTHDISDAPTPYGITPSFFRRVLDYVVTTGAVICTISEAVNQLHVAPQVAQQR